MRNLIIASSLLGTFAACESGPGSLKDPPVLRVTSPARSLVQDHAGMITVTGTVAPNAAGDQVQRVTVNNIPATVGADGKFIAVISVRPGATLIHTEAVDSEGGKAEDTRSVEAGDLRMNGSNVENALTVALSADAFAKIAGVASATIKTTDFKPLLAPMQPMVHSGDADGEDCLFARLFVDDVKMTDSKITLKPVLGGLAVTAELDGLDVPGHMRYAAACVNGQNNTRIQATKVVVKGTLIVTPSGNGTFATDLVDENVQLTGLHISASGIPGAVLSILPLDTAVTYIAPIAAKMVMGPMINKALGAAGGPQKLNVLGKTIDMQVDPTDVVFDPSGGQVTLDMKLLIEGTEQQGFIFTDNGVPSIDAGHGMTLGLADDLANELLSQVVSTGILNMSMPTQGGTFDALNISMTSPPMISADPTDGAMRLFLPDMAATFTFKGTPVANAAINAKVDLKIGPVNNGYGVALQLGTPEINIDVLDDIENATHFTNEDLSKAVNIGIEAQISSMSALLGSIPLPSVAGLQMRNLSIASDSGYVLMKGTLD
jgi:hypothetical protein